MKIKYPKVKFDNCKRIYVSFYLNNKRYRLFNGKKVNSEIYPNSYPVEERFEVGNLLAADIFKFIKEGHKINSNQAQNLIIRNKSEKEIISNAYNHKIKESISKKYKLALNKSMSILNKAFINNCIDKNKLIIELNKFTNNTTYNTVRRHINVILNKAVDLGLKSNPLGLIRSKRTKAKLHKPFTNLSEVLNEIKTYNINLYLCCLMTYGCLLRPHREVRELTWGDFSEDLKYINLSGHRNKSGKNRIVPVPSYIKNQLFKKSRNLNIFTAKPQPYSEDYFKGLWTKFKKQSKTLEPDQTLYSFRHTGATEIYKRTGSLSKLQKAMGHSSLKVSLTYLRGLEVEDLKEEDMPMI